MKHDNALSILRQIKPSIVSSFCAMKLALFGSTARNDAGDNSDIDTLEGA